VSLHGCATDSGWRKSRTRKGSSASTSYWPIPTEGCALSLHHRVIAARRTLAFGASEIAAVSVDAGRRRNAGLSASGTAVVLG
jgi:hypothetical protein